MSPLTYELLAIERLREHAVRVEQAALAAQLPRSDTRWLAATRHQLATGLRRLAAQLDPTQATASATTGRSQLATARSS